MDKKQKATFIRELGRELKKMRKERKLTTYRIMKNHNISMSKLASIEKGHHATQVDNLHELAQVYQTPLSDIIKNVEQRL